MRAWASWVGPVAGTPAGSSRPASCAPCPGAGRRSSPLLARSSPPPSPPGEPADIRPRCTSVAPSMGSATTLWKMAGGTVFNRQMSAGQSAHGDPTLNCRAMLENATDALRKSVPNQPTVSKVSAGTVAAPPLTCLSCDGVVPRGAHPMSLVICTVDYRTGQSHGYVARELG